MLYYDKKENQNYSERVLQRKGKSPNDPSVFPLYKIVPSYNHKTQYLNGTSSVKKVDGEDYYCFVYEILNRPIDKAKQNLMDYLETVRYGYEIAGTVTDSGTTVRTDRESQSMTSNAYQSLTSGLISDTDWKSPEGWITVTKTELEPIALTVANHVRKCFKAEKTISDKIESAETVDELTNLNIKESFETAYQSV